MATKHGNGTEDRIRILEKAVANLGDALKKRDYQSDEELNDVLRELRALKVFLARTVPEFKSQFPGIQRKVK
jgi:hypothetical protein